MGFLPIFGARVSRSVGRKGVRPRAICPVSTWSLATGANGQVMIVGSVAPGSMLVDNNARPYTFTGGSIAGATGLVKRGPGILVLGNSNSYSGATLIQSGRVAVYMNGALGSISQGTTVSSGAALLLAGDVNYVLPEALSITGQGPAGQGALENTGGNNVYAGPVTATGNATIGVSNGSLAISGKVSLPPSAVLDKNGSGALSLQNGIDWGSSSAITVTAGTLRLEPLAGSPITVSASSPTLTVLGGVTRVNASGQDPLTDAQNPTQHVKIVNNALNGFVIEAGAVGVDQISGPGSTLVADGASLTANRIVQSGLSLGAGGRVTLRPGGGTSVINSLNINAVIAGAPTTSAVYPHPWRRRR